MNRCYKPALTLALLISGIAGCAHHQTEGRQNMTTQPKIQSSSDAVDQVFRVTQLGVVSKKASAKETILATDDTPFLSAQFIGRPVWRVEFEQGSLKLKSAVPSFPDAYLRKFIVTIDKNTGRLIRVESKSEEKIRDIHPEPSPVSAENQMRVGKEIYAGIPDVDPKIAFMDALDIVLAKGIGSPFLAREICGVYVIHSKMGSQPRPVWVITLRGLPPMPLRGSSRDSVPVWQRNHMRNVVDALTGEFLLATSVPQPDS